MHYRYGDEENGVVVRVIYDREAVMSEVLVDVDDPPYQFSALKSTDPFDGPIGWQIEDPTERHIDIVADLLQYVPEALERHNSTGEKIRVPVRAFVAEVMEASGDWMHRLNGGI